MKTTVKKSYLNFLHYLIQTLIDLNLQANHIGYQGAKYLADALEINTV